MFTTIQAWFLDQFGVLHDGKQAYPGAVSTCKFLLDYYLHKLVAVAFTFKLVYNYLCVLMCLMLVRKLASSGAKMVIISNSSRRASTTMEKIGNLGFDPSLFVGAITSGELTYQHLQRLSTEPW